eukprot:1158934-Pelagomonas_calceolata.AAC.1
MAKANIHLERRYHRPTHVGQPMKEAHKPKQVFVERLQSEGNCSRETQPCCMLELISTIKAMQFLIPLPNKLNQGSPDIRAWDPDMGKMLRKGDPLAASIPIKCQIHLYKQCPMLPCQERSAA